MPSEHLHSPHSSACAGIWASTEAGVRMHAEIHASGGRPAGQELYVLDRGMAVVNVRGPLVRKTADAWPGETSYEAIRASVQGALDDPQADSIELFIDSPGGTVSGLPELASFIAGASRQKPMHAWIDGLGASAAYWLASATGDVRTSPSAQIGSIGVLYIHDDMTGLLRSFGVERTYMQSGRFKTEGAPKKLSAEERADIQAKLDAVYGQFTSFVARRMGLDLSKAEEWADGQIFDGETAKALGLVTSLQPFRDSAAETQTTWGNNTMAEKQTEAVVTAEAREAEILAVAGVVLGGDAQKRLAEALGTGLSAEQLEAQKAFWAVPAGQKEPEPAAEAPAPDARAVEDIVKERLSALLRGAQPVAAEGAKPTDKAELIKKIGHYGQED